MTTITDTKPAAEQMANYCQTAARLWLTARSQTNEMSESNVKLTDTLPNTESV